MLIKANYISTAEERPEFWSQVQRSSCELG
jgi:hypothetical protein